MIFANILGVHLTWTTIKSAPDYTLWEGDATVCPMKFTHGSTWMQLNGSVKFDLCLQCIVLKKVWTWPVHTWEIPFVRVGRYRAHHHCRPRNWVGYMCIIVVLYCMWPSAQVLRRKWARSEDLTSCSAIVLPFPVTTSHANTSHWFKSNSR